MATEIIVPRLGWSMEEGTFVGWLKRDGEVVRSGEALFSIEGDKAVQEIESIDSGILRMAANAPKPGEAIKVGLLLGHLLAEGEEISATSPVETVDDVHEPSAVSTKFSAAAEKLPASASLASGPRISPRAWRVAGELGVDWAGLRGSGRTGRIREQDVRAVARPPGSSREFIGQRMLQSLRSTAPVTLHTTARADGLVKLRQRLKVAAGNGSTVPSFTDMLVKISAAALQRHPVINSCWAGEKLVPSSSVHIGIAVDTEAGLLVPVIRDVVSLSLAQVAEQSRQLIARARDRKLSSEQMQGGTFTVTSLGAFGIDAFTPILNYPQCAILGVGRIQRQAVAEGEQVVLRDIISLSLTFDHCAFDGAPAARFLQDVCGLIEQESGELEPNSVLGGQKL